MRSPISRVLSVTVTSMMFMMPIPEIISAIADTNISTISRITPMLSAVLRISVRFSTVYLAPGRCRLSSTSRTMRVTATTSFADFTCTYMGSIRSISVKYFSTAIGIRTDSLDTSVCPKLSTLSLNVPITVNRMPYILIVWPIAPDWLPYNLLASFSVSKATRLRWSRSLASSDRPARITRLRTSL